MASGDRLGPGEVGERGTKQLVETFEVTSMFPVLMMVVVSLAYSKLINEFLFSLCGVLHVSVG